MIPRFARVSAHERNKRTSYIVVVIDLSDLISNLLVVGNAISFFFFHLREILRLRKIPLFSVTGRETFECHYYGENIFFFPLEKK